MALENSRATAKLVPVQRTWYVPERDADKPPILECINLGINFGGLAARGIHVTRAEKFIFRRRDGETSLIAREPLFGDPVFGNPAETDQGIFNLTHKSLSLLTFISCRRRPLS